MELCGSEGTHAVQEGEGGRKHTVGMQWLAAPGSASSDGGGVGCAPACSAEEC